MKRESVSPVEPNHWSQTNEKVLKQREDEPENNYIAINKRLSLVKEKADRAINDALRDEIVITEAYLKNAIINHAGKQRKTNQTFFDVLDEYIESSKAVRTTEPSFATGLSKTFSWISKKTPNTKSIFTLSISSSLTTSGPMRL